MKQIYGEMRYICIYIYIHSLYNRLYTNTFTIAIFVFDSDYREFIMRMRACFTLQQHKVSGFVISPGVVEDISVRSSLLEQLPSCDFPKMNSQFQLKVKFPNINPHMYISFLSDAIYPSPFQTS